MAELKHNPKVTTEITLKLTEGEARALEALSTYGVDAFITVFYKEMGRHYLEPHEDGLRSLLASTHEILPSILKRVDEARKVFYKD